MTEKNKPITWGQMRSELPADMQERLNKKRDEYIESIKRESAGRE